MTIIETRPEIDAPAIIDYAPLIKRRLQEKGWIQGKYRDLETGEVCTMGAVYGVLGCDAPMPFLADGPGQDEIEMKAREIEGRLMYAAFDATGFARYEDIESWNDAPGRTVEAVYDLIDAADLKLPV